ncbi:hypothetical protein [Spirillospora sp. CA-294931]|uniref:hypothetical protein n=1 Tax=Spirillospora sp. CA-294931 TaxID=3240042 RepID=UPI003D8A5385
MSSQEPAFPLLLRPNLAASYIGISRTELFRLLREGVIPSELPSPRVRLIPRSACDAYAATLAARALEE